MGDFDFGQFQQIYEYLIGKIEEGGSLTPEEQQAYDMLLGFANQGLNLTGTGDFQSLYTAFNALADEGTKAEFERLYGTGLINNGNAIQFTRPGTLIEAMQRRGQSVLDGPAQAVLSEGLQKYLAQIASNKFASMTNSYQAMTPIRQQNIDAASRAGQLGGAGASRRASIVPPSVSGARAGGGPGGGGGGGEGEGREPIKVPLPPQPDRPSPWEQMLPDILKALATGTLGVGGVALREWMRGDGKTKTPEGKDLDSGPLTGANPDGSEKYLPDWADPAELTRTARGYDAMGSAESYDPYTINMAAYTGGAGLDNPYSGNPTPYEWPDAQTYGGNAYMQPPQQNYEQNYEWSPNQGEGWDNYYASGGYDPWTGGGNYYVEDSSWYDQPETYYDYGYEDSGWGWDDSFYGDSYAADDGGYWW